MQGNPEALFGSNTCLASIALFEHGEVKSVWTKPRAAPGISFFAGYSKATALNKDAGKAEAEGTSYKLQINIGKPYLKAFEHDW